MNWNHRYLYQPWTRTGIQNWLYPGPELVVSVKELESPVPVSPPGPELVVSSVKELESPVPVSPPGPVLVNEPETGGVEHEKFGIALTRIGARLGSPMVSAGSFK